MISFRNLLKLECVWKQRVRNNQAMSIASGLYYRVEVFKGLRSENKIDIYLGNLDGQSYRDMFNLTLGSPILCIYPIPLSGKKFVGAK